MLCLYELLGYLLDRCDACIDLDLVKLCIFIRWLDYLSQVILTMYGDLI